MKINAFPTDGNKVILYWPESTQDESYIVKYRIKGNKNWSNQTAGSIRAEVSGLDFGRIYEFQVFTKLGGQEKAYTEVREVKIAEGKLGVQFTFPLIYISDRRITLGNLPNLLFPT